MKRLKILLLVTNLGQGGAQRVFYDQAISLARHHQVEEAVFDLRGGERVYNSGLPLRQLTSGIWLSRLGPLGRLLSRALALRALVQQENYDVVISHMDGANWVNVLSGSTARKILVVHGTVLHDSNVTRLVQCLRRTLIFPHLYNWANYTVAVSAGIAFELERHCGVRKVIAIPNSFRVDTIDRAAQVPVEANLEPVFDHPLVMVASARLEIQKNLASLLDILSGLLAVGQRPRLVILGDGTLRPDLIRRAHTLGLRVFDIWSSDPATVGNDHDVWFLGYVTNPFTYLARGTIFLLPSAWEGFPLALCEAMICGLPVISADCPTGPREILAPGEEHISFIPLGFHIAANGILVPIPTDANTQDAWIKAITHVVNDSSLYTSLAARGRKAGEAMDQEKGLSAWLDLLEQVTRPGPRSVSKHLS